MKYNLVERWDYHVTMHMNVVLSSHVEHSMQVNWKGTIEALYNTVVTIDRRLTDLQ